MKVAVAPFALETILREELGGRLREERGRLFFYDGADPLWAQNLWLNPETFRFASIGEAAKHLRSLQRNWVFHSVSHHRRGQLIQEQLPPFKTKPIAFLASVPTAPLGVFTLLDQETMVYSQRCSSPFPDGEVDFIEDKTPPSRAYLKLWEFFTLTGKHPRAGERAIDLGSSPGGWTWVLDQLGCDVVSVDKAALATDLPLSKRVQFVQESAFGLEPSSVGRVDWLFSDIICYPDRLLNLVERWRESGLAKNFVCTIKFQDRVDHSILERFLAIPNSQVRHLRANKHEITWSLID